MSAGTEGLLCLPQAFVVVLVSVTAGFFLSLMMRGSRNAEISDDRGNCGRQLRQYA